MKRALIATAATVGGLWALALILANTANVLDGIAYTLPDVDTDSLDEQLDAYRAMSEPTWPPTHLFGA